MSIQNQFNNDLAKKYGVNVDKIRLAGLDFLECEGYSNGKLYSTLNCWLDMRFKKPESVKNTNPFYAAPGTFSFKNLGVCK